jgi:hypothetical protein
MNQPLTESGRLRESVKTRQEPSIEQPNESIQPQQLFEAFQLLDNVNEVSTSELRQKQKELIEDYISKFNDLPLSLRHKSDEDIASILAGERKGKQKQLLAALDHKPSDLEKQEIKTAADRQVPDISESQKVTSAKAVLEGSLITAQTQDPDLLVDMLWEGFGSTIRNLTKDEYLTQLRDIVPNVVVLKQLVSELEKRDGASGEGREERISAVNMSLHEIRRQEAVVNKVLLLHIPFNQLSDQERLLLTKIVDENEGDPTKVSEERKNEIFREVLTNSSEYKIREQKKLDELMNPSSSEMLSRSALDEFDIEGLQMQQKYLPMTGINSLADMVATNKSQPREAIYTFKWMQDLDDGGEPQFDRDYPNEEDPQIQKRAMLTRFVDLVSNHDLLLIGKEPQDIGLDPDQIKETQEDKIARMIKVIDDSLEKDTELEPDATKNATRLFREQTIPKLAWALLTYKTTESSEVQGHGFKAFLQEAIQVREVFQGEVPGSKVSFQEFLDFVRLAKEGELSVEQENSIDRIFILDQMQSENENDKKEFLRESLSFTKSIFGKLQKEEIAAKRGVELQQKKIQEERKKERELADAAGQVIRRTSERVKQLTSDQSPEERLSQVQKSTGRLDKMATSRLSEFDQKLASFDKRREELEARKQAEIHRLAQK